MNNFELFLINQWGFLQRKYIEEPPIDEINKAIKSTLKIWWWRIDLGKKEYSRLWETNPDERIVFLSALINLGKGDFTKYKMIRDVLRRRKNSILLFILKIYELGAKNKIDEIIDLLKSINALNYDKDKIYTAIINSLLDDGMNYKNLSNYLEKNKIDSDVYEALMIKFCKSEFITMKSEEEIKQGYLQYHLALKLWKKYNFKNALQLFDYAAHNFFMDKVSIRAWLNISLSTPQGFNSLPNRVSHASYMTEDKRFSHEIKTYLIIYSWLKANYEQAYTIAKSNIEFISLDEKDEDKNMQIFFIYSISLCAFWQNHRNIYEFKKHQEIINCIGESHCLSPANTIFEWNNKILKANSFIIMGIKMWHLATKSENIQKNYLLNYLNKIDKNTHILLTIGEIDTRPNEGIWKITNQGKNNLDDVITETVNGYISFLEKFINNFQSITIQGIPAPGYKLTGKRDPIDKAGFLSFIRKLNIYLKIKTLSKGWNFFDVYEATANSEGLSNNLWHLDGFHLKPSIYQENKTYIINPNTLLS